MTAKENQIIVYQPNETVRLDVRLENETVWLTQTQLCDFFGVVKSNISYHLTNIFGQVSWTTGQLFKKIEHIDIWRHWNRRHFHIGNIQRKEGRFKMIFRLGELFCGPGGLACGTRMAGLVVAHSEVFSHAETRREAGMLPMCKCCQLPIPVANDGGGMKIDARTTDLQVVSSYVEDDRELNVQNRASGSVRE